MRLYRKLDGSGIAITRNMDEIDALRERGFTPLPECPFSMEPFSDPYAKVWYDFPIQKERWHEVKALAGQS